MATVARVALRAAQMGARRGPSLIAPHHRIRGRGAGRMILRRDSDPVVPRFMGCSSTLPWIPPGLRANLPVPGGERVPHSVPRRPHLYALTLAGADERSANSDHLALTAASRRSAAGEAYRLSPGTAMSDSRTHLYPRRCTSWGNPEGRNGPVSALGVAHLRGTIGGDDGRARRWHCVEAAIPIPT